MIPTYQLVNTDGNNTSLTPLSLEEAQQITNKPDRFYVLAMSNPPLLGLLSFSTFLEFSAFPPKTKTNEEMLMMLVDAQGLNFQILGFPLYVIDIVRLVAKRCGLDMMKRKEMLLYGPDGETQFIVGARENDYVLQPTEELKNISQAEQHQRLHAELARIQTFHDNSKENRTLEFRGPLWV